MTLPNRPPGGPIGFVPPPVMQLHLVDDRTFWPMLAAWVLLYPLHAPLTLLVFDAPFGKFAWKSMLNLPGNTAWFVMETVAALTFMINLDAGALTPPARTLAALFLMHYLHRAVVSPLIIAPTRSPIHIIVVIAAVIFNRFNATLVARGLAMFPPSDGWTFYAGIALWAAGFAGNVYHDEILHDLRRKPAQQLVSTPSTKPEDKDPSGRYTIPQGGLFRFVSMPNYLCEWLEWTGFALAAAPTPLVSVPAGALTMFKLLGHTFDISWAAQYVPLRLLAPPWAFVFNEVVSMLPRAIRSHQWYKATFKHYPKERKAVIPGLL